MSNRGLSAATITALGNPNVEFYHLVRMDFSTPLYYTVAPYDIDHGGNTYTSSVVVLDIPTITESLKIKPTTISLRTSGATTAIHALTLTENYKNAEVSIYIYEVSTKEVTQIFLGYIDHYESVENQKSGTSVVTWSIANHWANWEAIEGRFLTDAYQQDLFSGDLGLEFANITPPSIGWWGNATAIAGLYNSNYNGHLTPDSAQWIDAKTDLIADEIFGHIWHKVEPGVLTGIVRADTSVLHSSRKRLPIVYGQHLISGYPVFRGNSGAGNKYRWVVYALAEGECEDLVDITFDGVSYTDAKISSKILMVKATNWHSGADDQTVDVTLDADADLTQWTSAHRLRGICYCAIRYEYNKNIWSSGEPEPLFEIKGKKLYDPRDGTTAYSTNPALVLYDYLTSTRQGKSITGNLLDAFDTGADYCETQQTDHDEAEGGSAASINLFDFTGIIETSKSIKSNVEKILFTMRAHLPWVNGKYKLVIERHDDIGTFEIDDDNIHRDYDFKVSEGGIKGLANFVTYDFIDAGNNYEKAQVISQSATFLADDNNRALKKSVTNKYEPNRYRATNRAATILKISRQQIGVSCTLRNSNALQLEPGVIVNLTRSLQGWVQKPFRIEEIKIPPNLRIELSLMEYESTVYDWNVSVETDPPANTTLLDPFDIVAPTNLTVTATDTESITSADGTTLHRLKVEWTAAADQFVVRYPVQYRKSGAANWIDFQPAEGQATAEIYIHGVNVGNFYDVRIRSENGLGKYSEWITVTSTEVTGTGVFGLNNKLIGTDAYENDSFFFHTPFDSLDAYTITNATIDVTEGLKITGNASVVSHNYRDFLTQNITLTNDKSHHFKTIIKLTGASNIVSTFVTIAGARTGFKLYWNSGTSKIDIKGWNRDATTEAITSTIVSVADGTTIFLECIFTTGVKVEFIVTISGTDYTATSTINLPTGTNEANRPIWIAIGNGTAGALLFVGDYVYGQLA